MTLEEFSAELENDPTGVAVRQLYSTLLALVERGALTAFDLYQYARFRWYRNHPEAVVAYQTGPHSWAVNTCDAEYQEECAKLLINSEWGFEASRIEILGTLTMNPQTGTSFVSAAGRMTGSCGMEDCIRFINKKREGVVHKPLPPVLFCAYWIASFSALPALNTGSLAAGISTGSLVRGGVADPGITLFHLERAEAHQLHLVFRFQRVGYRFSQGARRGLTVFLTGRKRKTMLHAQTIFISKSVKAVKAVELCVFQLYKNSIRRRIAMLIAVDHGNKLVKVVNHAPFTSGLQESDSPPFGGETMKYQGKYYTLSEKRIPYHRDKTEDERFWILTLFAIAYEVQAAGAYSPNLMRVQLAVGLPPAHYGAQHKSFANYFTGRGAVQFEFQGKTYSIFIEKVMCFP